MEKMTLKHNILFFTPIFPPLYSGATFQALTLARELKIDGNNIIFLTFHEKQPSESCMFYRENTFENFHVYSIPSQNLNEIINGTCKLSKHLGLMIKIFIILCLIRNKYSIIHCHTLAFPFSGISLIGRLLRRKTISKSTMSEDGNFSSVGKKMGKIHKYCISKFTCIIAISSMIYKSLSETIVEKNRLKYLPNGVNCKMFQPISKQESKLLKRKLNLPNNFIATFVGGVTKRKGADVLTKSCVEFMTQRVDSTLLFVGPKTSMNNTLGDVYCYEEILGYLRQHDLSNRVIFTGRVDNVKEYLQCSDVLVFPSQLEGMPNVVLEAMACAVPVISFEVSGVSDIITDGVNGSIVAPADTATFRKAIEQLYKDEPLREQYSEAARQTILKHFDLRIIAEKYDALYKLLLH